MLNKKELESVRKTSLEAAETAGKLLMRFFRKQLEVREKARSSLVTQADVNSEAIIKKILQKKFPSFSFLGEESGHEGSTATDHPTWHVDPLDGTTNFVHGFPMFCVSIGLAIGNKPVVGVIHIPALGETFHGAHELGARWNRKPMRVSQRKKLSDCLLTTGFAYLQDASKLDPEIHRFRAAHLEARAVRRPGAAAIDLAYVASGVFDAFWERNLSTWDVCAGALLVKEAGGKVTDYSGGPLELYGKEILASNPHIHQNMIKILA